MECRGDLADSLTYTYMGALYNIKPIQMMIAMSVKNTHGHLQYQEFLGDLADSLIAATHDHIYTWGPCTITHRNDVIA